MAKVVKMKQKKKRKKMQHKEVRRKLELSKVTANVWLSVLFLCLFGLMMVYSASSYTCQVENHDDMFLLKKQAVFMLIGFGVMFFGQFFDYKYINRIAILVYIIGLGTIVALLTGIGISSNGATRWLNLKVITVQPAEIVKVTTIVMLAYMVSKYAKHIDNWRLTLYMWVLGGIPASLLYKISNDLSSGLVVLGMTYICTLVACNTKKMHAGILALGIVGASGYVYSIASNMPSVEEIEAAGFRVGRIAAWLDPERYANSVGYQVLQAQYAIASGGFFGKGLGESAQKISKIPEAQNDMIFSIICEELGVFGAVAVLILVVILLYELVQIALHAESLYGAIIVVGVVAHIGLQTIINVAVNCNAFPNTGLALPFISYGGSSVVCLLIEIMLCLEVNWRSELRHTLHDS